MNDASGGNGCACGTARFCPVHSNPTPQPDDDKVSDGEVPLTHNHDANFHCPLCFRYGELHAHAQYEDEKPDDDKEWKCGECGDRFPLGQDCSRCVDSHSPRPTPDKGDAGCLPNIIDIDLSEVRRRAAKILLHHYGHLCKPLRPTRCAVDLVCEGLRYAAERLRNERHPREALDIEAIANTALDQEP